MAMAKAAAKPLPSTRSQSKHPRQHLRNLSDKFICVNTLHEYLSAEIPNSGAFGAKTAISARFGLFDLCRTTAVVKPFQTSAVQRHRSVFRDLCRWKAAIWERKAEVCEGAEGLLSVFLKDLQCSC